MDLLQTFDATCPHCWESVSLTLDLSASSQSYIEDCPVCCGSMQVSYTCDNGELGHISVEAAD